MSQVKITPPITTMQDAFSVKGKNVVVTGGSRGIGRGIVQAFAESGANVAILDIKDDVGKRVCQELAPLGGRYACIRCDIADEASIKRAVAETYQFFDCVNVLVNNAGISTTAPRTHFLDKDLSEWRKIVDVDLIGAAALIHAFAPHMIEANLGGEIINITSIGAVSVSGCKEFHNPAYNAAKAGGDVFTRYLAIALGDYGIRVNAIRPGPHHSDLEIHLSDYMKNLIDNEMPCHRFGEPIELGAFCVYLSSPAAVHITGCNMNFDGGMLCVK